MGQFMHSLLTQDDGKKKKRKKEGSDGYVGFDKQDSTEKKHMRLRL